MMCMDVTTYCVSPVSLKYSRVFALLSRRRTRKRKSPVQELGQFQAYPLMLSLTIPRPLGPYSETLLILGETYVDWVEGGRQV